MDLYALLDNHLIINSLAAWAAAQIIKTILYAVMHGELDFHRLFGDGGMPSGHSATVTAMGVRLEAGKHARVLNQLMASFTGEVAPEDVLKEFLGHTPLQVCFGALLGFCMALLLG